MAFLLLCIEPVYSKSTRYLADNKNNQNLNPIEVAVFFCNCGNTVTLCAANTKLTETQSQLNQTCMKRAWDGKSRCRSLGFFIVSTLVWEKPICYSKLGRLLWRMANTRNFSFIVFFTAQIWPSSTWFYNLSHGGHMGSIICHVGNTWVSHGFYNLSHEWHMGSIILSHGLPVP